LDTIKATEIKVGDVITVLEWTSIKCRSFQGEPMLVKVVDLPFLVCENLAHDPEFFLRGPWTLNTNELVIGWPSPEFVKATRKA